MDKINAIVKSEEAKNVGKEMLDIFINALSGDHKAWSELACKMKGLPMSAKTLLFYYNFGRFLEGMSYDEDEMHMFREFLNAEDKREENSKRIIQLIDGLDSDLKVDALINLTKSASYNFITKRQYFRLSRLVQDLLVEDLQYIRERICKGRLNRTDLYEEFEHNELMYMTNDAKYAYTQMAFELDKYGLSYGDDKYRYNGEADASPTPNEMPSRYSPLFLSGEAEYITE